MAGIQNGQRTLCTNLSYGISAKFNKLCMIYTYSRKFWSVLCPPTRDFGKLGFKLRNELQFKWGARGSVFG
jgi:hypothetical protein